MAKPNLQPCGHPERFRYWTTALNSSVRCQICDGIPGAVSAYAAELLHQIPIAENESSFARSIIEAPTDPTPRLIFADWLDEQGDPRGELIRVEVEYETLVIESRGSLAALGTEGLKQILLLAVRSRELRGDLEIPGRDMPEGMMESFLSNSYRVGSLTTAFKLTPEEAEQNLQAGFPLMNSSLFTPPENPS